MAIVVVATMLLFCVAIFVFVLPLLCFLWHKLSNLDLWNSSTSKVLLP